VRPERRGGLRSAEALAKADALAAISRPACAKPKLRFGEGRRTGAKRPEASTGLGWEMQAADAASLMCAMRLGPVHLLRQRTSTAAPAIPRIGKLAGEACAKPLRVRSIGETETITLRHVCLPHRAADFPRVRRRGSGSRRKSARDRKWCFAPYGNDLARKSLRTAYRLNSFALKRGMRRAPWPAKPRRPVTAQPRTTGRVSNGRDRSAINDVFRAGDCSRAR
jgi:hypothetical protein